MTNIARPIGYSWNVLRVQCAFDVELLQKFRSFDILEDVRGADWLNGALKLCSGDDNLATGL